MTILGTPKETTEINPCRKIPDIIHAKVERVVEVRCNMQAKDYHDQVLCILKELPNYLWGGYYEPCSDRDVKLAQELEKFYQDYEKSLDL